jgi:LacI family transcriptional regulator
MDPALDGANIRVLRARQADALMMAPVVEDDPQVLRLLLNLDIPFVDVEGDLPANVPASYVRSDHRAGIVAALGDLIARGHERISVIVGSSAFRSARERMLGVEDVSAGSAPHVRIVAFETALDPGGARAAVGRALSAEPPPSALIVGGWQLLTGVLHELRERSLRLGVDIALVASDPPRLASVFEPPIAAITRDTAGLGIRAAELLLARIAQPGMAAERVMLPTLYVPAASAGLSSGITRLGETPDGPRRRRRAQDRSGSPPPR